MSKFICILWGGIIPWMKEYLMVTDSRSEGVIADMPACPYAGRKNSNAMALHSVIQWLKIP